MQFEIFHCEKSTFVENSTIFATILYLFFFIYTCTLGYLLWQYVRMKFIGYATFHNVYESQTSIYMLCIYTTQIFGTYLGSFYQSKEQLRCLNSDFDWWCNTDWPKEKFERKILSPGQVLLRQQTEKETNLRSSAPSQSQSIAATRSQSPRAKSVKSQNERKSRQSSAASQRLSDSRLSRRTNDQNETISRVPSATKSGPRCQEMNARRKSNKPIIRNNGERKIPTKKTRLFTKIEAKPKPPVMPPVLKQWLDFKPNMDPKNPIAEPSEHEKGLNLFGIKMTAAIK